jgi:hypothetical protein
MQTDRYLKVVLTIIALALVGNLWRASGNLVKVAEGVPPADKPGGGNAEVLSRLDEIEAKMDTEHADIEAKLDMVLNQLDVGTASATSVGGKVAAILDEVARGRINTGMTFCVDLLSGGLGIESGFENELKIKARAGLGVNLWGNQATGKGDFDSAGKSAFKANGGIGATWQWCIESRGRSFLVPPIQTAPATSQTSVRTAVATNADGTDFLATLADAMDTAEVFMTDEIATHAEEIGFDPQNLVDRAQTAMALWREFELPENPFEIFDKDSQIRTQIADLIRQVPVPERVQEKLAKLQDPEALIPDSFEQFNICDPTTFKFEIPDGKLKDMIAQACDFGDQILELGGVERPLSIAGLKDNALNKLERIVAVKDQLNAALNAIIRMEEAIAGIYDALDTLTSVPALTHPPSFPGQTGGPSVCQELPSWAPRPALCSG